MLKESQMDQSEGGVAMRRRGRPRNPRTADRHNERRMIGLPIPLYGQLSKLAADNKRPLRWQVIMLLEDCLASVGMWPPATE
jgi:hypothetical protein